MSTKRNNNATGDLVASNIGGRGKRVVIDEPVHSDTLQIGPGGVFVNGERVNGPDRTGGAR